MSNKVQKKFDKLEFIEHLLIFHTILKNQQNKKPQSVDCGFFGAAKQIRTADLFLTKEVLCLLSYSSLIHKKQPLRLLFVLLATRMGLEPTTSSVTG